MIWRTLTKGSALLLATLCVTAAPTGAGGLPLPPLSAPAGEQAFALYLFQTLCRLQPTTNALVSPVSVYTALMMTANGARGATQTAMARSLGFEPALQRAMETQLADYLAQVAEDGGSATLHLANAIWTGAGTPPEKGFVAAMETQYRTVVKSLPAEDPTTAVNGWVREQTRGKIDRIVEKVDPQLTLLLLNAAYFKDAWQTPFSAKATTDGLFHRADGGTQTAAYMTRRGQFEYLAGKGIQLVSLSYRDPRYRMLILLPGADKPLDALIGSLDPTRLAGWLKNLSHAEGRVSLPRFKLSAGYSLKKPLMEMGMETAFDGDRADFGGITPSRPFAIGDVKHRCVLTVDEAGSEAAAVTAVEMFGAAPPSGAPFEFRAERPFICLLQDRSAGRILFMAAVYQPEPS
jgi:serpin B